MDRFTSSKRCVTRPTVDLSSRAIESKEEKKPLLVEEFEILPYLQEALEAGKSGNSRFNKPRFQKSKLPPALQTTPAVKHTFRFRCTTTGSYPIQTGFLFGTCGALALTSTSVQNLASSIKIHSVTAFLPATAVGTADTCLVLWNTSTSAGFIKDQAVTTSLPDGITTPGAMRFTPPKDSLASDWLSSLLNFSNTCFTVACPVGTILDLNISYTLQNQMASYSATTVSTATAGRIYYLPLDGVSSNKLQAQGVTTTA